LHACFPSIRLVWADSGYAGQLVGWATQRLHLTVQIVAKLAGQTTFFVLHRRWAVERTFSWINRCRRTVRDYERLPQHHAAMVQWAMIIIMTRRLARHRLA
jgi:transposase